MARWTTRWFLSLQIALYLLLILVQANKDTEEAYKNGRTLVLEYFLPINAPVAVDVVSRREKRDVEGSGEDDLIFSEINDKSGDENDNSTQNAFAKLLLHEGEKNYVNSLSNVEGSGDIDKEHESESSEGNKDADVVPIISENEIFTTTEHLKMTETTGKDYKPQDTSTEMIFDKSENFDEHRSEETTTVAPDSAVILETTTVGNYEEVKQIITDGFQDEITTTKQYEYTTAVPDESTTVNVPITIPSEIPLESSTEPTTTVAPKAIIVEEEVQKSEESATELTTVTNTEAAKQFTTTPSTQITLLTQANMTEEFEKTVITENIIPTTKETTKAQEIITTLKFVPSVATHDATEIPKIAPTTAEPIVEEIFKESKIQEKLEAMPGNILQKQNLSLAADPLLIMNTRVMDSEETVQLSSSEPKRLGAYIIIGLILLSFSSLVGYITFRRRMNRKRREFESNQESNDTEKALLSLSDYKDSSELEENHLKNNEITPIVVKSNSQINKFEKNTNFSSPKNLNTTANEKNIEKDNVLKSTAENLTQVIIEGSPKDVEEDKSVPNMEKLIVKTRIDQDSIPKKPIIINRTSTGYIPIPQDNM